MSALSDGVTAATEGTTYELNDETWTVGPKCDEKDGNWVCATHSRAFSNQMMKDNHVTDTGVHVLVWNCISHGPEVP